MNLALFDFDHTITTVDTYARFLRQVATPERLARAKWTVAPWLIGYRMGMVPARTLRARATFAAFNGRPEDGIHEHGARYAREEPPDLLRPEMMQRIDWHKSQGDTMVVVSGSLDVYLRPWCEAHGLALICNRLEAVAGQLTGRYRDGDCGSDKAERIRARYDTASYPLVYAYGDKKCCPWRSNAGSVVAG